MTTTPPPSGPTGRSGLSPLAAVLLFVVVPIAALTLLVGVALLTLALVRGTPVHLRYDTAAGSSVSVAVPNAQFSIGPSGDDRVHVVVDGSYFGAKPGLTVRTSGDETTVRGGCEGGWLSRCSLRVAVTLPESLDLTVQSTNGKISLTQLTGSVGVTTTNGRIEATRLGGAIDVRTTNGPIGMRDMASREVIAGTTNGAVELAFTEPPTSVDARSTNGAITVRVPDDNASYFVSARTTNGGIDTDAVPSDRTADRTITAETTNGSVTVGRTSR